MNSKNISEFNSHPLFEGQHAFLSPSNYHWLNYTDEKLLHTYRTKRAAELGTELHNFAKIAIQLKQKLPNSKKTINSFVNDAIGFRMKPEVVLVYSPICFGTADAIAFRDGLLRIHDLKTGVSKVSMTQLLIYAALFSLEYGIAISDINTELRIYQNDEILINRPDKKEVEYVKEKIIAFDNLIMKTRKEEEHVG